VFTATSRAAHGGKDSAAWRAARLPDLAASLPFDGPFTAIDYYAAPSI